MLQRLLNIYCSLRVDNNHSRTAASHIVTLLVLALGLYLILLTDAHSEKDILLHDQDIPGFGFCE